ncbi:MAG: YkgJ family cysteine cluster protein [Desulfomonile tiedjei]|nr:YkgJ family cysteine cluster protein [Desulfomonile tiedjei]
MTTYNKAELDFFVTAIKEEARTVIWKVGSNADPQALVKSVLEDLEALAPRDDGSDRRSEEEIWTQVRERLLKAAYATRPHCIRCGTCCTTGSPTLVVQDLDLIARDLFKPQQLTTIRKGEMTYSVRTEKPEPAVRELIKVREKPGTRTCIFYDTWAKNCSIYESRPYQCRQQECWNPESIDTIGEAEPLDREALLRSVGPLWDVICRHEERCSHAELGRIMARLGATSGQTVEDVMELLRFDHHVRHFITEKLDLDPDAMDFFFGPPLSKTVELYGLQVEEQPDGSFLLTMVEQSG